jgi:hypothetical protein
MAKSAEQFIDDLLEGRLQEQQTLLQNSGTDALEEFLKKQYDSDPEAIREAVMNSRDKLEKAIGMKLTDEQLAGLAGGKSQAESIAGQVGAGVGGAVGGTLAVIVLIVK